MAVMERVKILKCVSYMRWDRGYTAYMVDAHNCTDERVFNHLKLRERVCRDVMQEPAWGPRSTSTIADIFEGMKEMLQTDHEAGIYITDQLLPLGKRYGLRCVLDSKAKVYIYGFRTQDAEFDIGKCKVKDKSSTEQLENELEKLGQLYLLLGCDTSGIKRIKSAIKRIIQAINKCNEEASTYNSRLRRGEVW